MTGKRNKNMSIQVGNNRNGVFISFPEFECKNGDVRNDIISGARVSRSMRTSKRSVPNKQKKVAYINVNVNVGRVPQRPKSVIKINTGKRCMRCGEACWRSDVNYCWDCYKYEKFESR